MGPIDYSQGQTQQDFLKNFQSGLQLGSGIQQADLAKQQMLAYQNDVHQAMVAPTPANFAALALKYPAQREAIKQSFDTLSEGDRNDQQSFGTQAYSALLSGNPDIAQKITQKRIEARKNSGLDTSHEENLLSIIQKDPSQAQAALGFTLSHISDPKSFATQFAALNADKRAEQLQPSLVDKGVADAGKAQADSVKAAADATVAQSTIPALTEKASLDNKLAELDRQIAAADSETKRGQLQLERDKLTQQQTTTAQAAGTDAQNQLDGVQNGLATVESLLNHPGLKSGTGFGSTVASFFNGTDAKDFRLQVETLKSQQFLAAAQSLKGMGALSDAEGARLERSIASLDPNMSTAQFKNNLGIIKKTLNTAYQKALANPKTPTAGGAVAVAKHPVYGTVREGDINRLLKQFPGTTRDQVIEYLNSTGGK